MTSWGLKADAINTRSSAGAPWFYETDGSARQLASVFSSGAKSQSPIRATQVSYPNRSTEKMLPAISYRDKWTDQRGRSSEIAPSHVIISQCSKPTLFPQHHVDSYRRGCSS